jgi:hypothetical protein
MVIFKNLHIILTFTCALDLKIHSMSAFLHRPHQGDLHQPAQRLC